MNCLAFRRLLLQDPFAEDPAMREHEQACASCRRHAEELRAQEVQLRELLEQFTPPPELADNIQLAIRLDRRARSRRRAWYAMAASVVLIVGATMTSLVNQGWERGNMALAQSVLNHIDDESAHLHQAGPVTASRAKFVFARFGAELTGDIGPINFAAECFMRQRNGVHLVIPGERGPITAFYMPGEHTRQTIPVESNRFQGWISPMPWGSVAVVGEPGEELRGLAERLGAAVRWPASQPSGIGAATPAPPTLVAQQ